MAGKELYEKAQLQIDAASDKGCVRDRNEDMALVGNLNIRNARYTASWAVSKHKPFVVSVADGMGGQQGGDVASEKVTDGLCCFVKSLTQGLDKEGMRTCLSLWIQNMHDELLEDGVRQPELWGMGTTLTGLLFYEGGLYTFNVGDSRIYRLRDGVLRQLTVDHTLRQKLGDISLPGNAIYNSVGGGPVVFVDMEAITSMIFPEDLFLLCSDGLYDMLPDGEIERLLSEQCTAAGLIEAAKTAGGRDNVSLILVRIVDLA